MKTRLLTIGMSLLCGIGVPGAQTPQPAPGTGRTSRSGSPPGAGRASAVGRRTARRG